MYESGVFIHIGCKSVERSTPGLHYSEKSPKWWDPERSNRNGRSILGRKREFLGFTTIGRKLKLAKNEHVELHTRALSMKKSLWIATNG
jgi:hypothetical protein